MIIVYVVSMLFLSAAVYFESTGTPLNRQSNPKPSTPIGWLFWAAGTIGFIAGFFVFQWWIPLLAMLVSFLLHSLLALGTRKPLEKFNMIIVVFFGLAGLVLLPFSLLG